MRAPFIILVAALFVFAACVQAPPATDTNETNETNETVGNYTPANESMQTPDEEEFAPEDYDSVVAGVEGEEIRLNPQVTDPDGDEVAISFQPPFDENGVWQTTIGDAGEFLTVITASDGELETTARILIRVEQANLPPVIVGPEAFILNEGDVLDLTVYNITDPEGDDVIVSYTGWTTSSTTQTTFGDAGVYNGSIIAQDTAGNEAQKDFTVIIDAVNRAPILELEQTSVEVTEGDVVRLSASAQDPDGDTVTIRFGQPLDATGRWATSRGDAGTYQVPVTASDGTDTVEEVVTVTVNPANRAPVIDVESMVTVRETQTVDLGSIATITDPDGDAVDVTYTGWMTEPTKDTDFGDAGEYTVTITATDGELTSSATVTVVVEQTNRAPEFIRPA